MLVSTPVLTWLRLVPSERGRAAVGAAEPRLLRVGRRGGGARLGRDPGLWGSSRRADTPCPTQWCGGTPCVRGGREAGLRLGQGHLGPDKALLGAGCAPLLWDPFPCDQAAFLGEDLRGEVACGAEWGLCCCLRGTWGRQRFPCQGLGAGAPSSPAELDREQALLPKRQTAKTSSFLPMGCPCDCIQAVG